MADRPERILALDIDSAIVRGIVLANGPQAVAGGYAQLGFDDELGPAAVATRIAAALDVKAMLPVVVTCADTLAESTIEEIVSTVRAAGFTTISVVPRDQSMRRSNPGGGQTDKLVDADIASGLLTSHAGLTLGDLAPVVGAGLGVLGLGAPTIEDDAVDEPVPVWHPDAAPTSTTANDDPFTAGDNDVVAGAAAITAAAAAAAGFDDEPTETRTPASVDDVAGAERFELDDETVPPTATIPPAETAGSAPAPFEEDATEPPDSSNVHGALAGAGMTHAEAASDTEADEPDQAEPKVAPGPSFVAAPAPVPAAGSASLAARTPERNKGPLIALAVGLLVALALGAFVLLDRGADEVAGESEVAPSAPPLAAPEVEPDTTVEPDPAPEPTSAPEPDATAEPDPTPSPEPTSNPEPTVDPLEGLPPLSSLPERGAVFRPPTLYLEGPVQTQEQADELYARAIAVVGPDNVVNEYVVRPDAPAALDGNVRVEQAVLFETGSSAISDDFIPTLELGVAVMSLNPQVQMVVEGHTDSVGEEADNQVLSERRAQAVVEYLVGRGVGRERLQAVGLGESTPVDSNDTPEGRQVNRRIEVNLLDLLSGE